MNLKNRRLLLRYFLPVLVWTLILSTFVFALGEAPPYQLTFDNFKDEKPVELNKTNWKYRLGDNEAWAQKDLNDADWPVTEGSTLKSDQLTEDWQGRAWFRLQIMVDETAANQPLILQISQRGATEIYLDGKLVQTFGKFEPDKITEYNPNGLPIPIVFDGAGQHTLAVRYGTQTFGTKDSAVTQWLLQGKVSPGLIVTLKSSPDSIKALEYYKLRYSMRWGYLFVGVLLALALLHFLLYLFYRVERANLFYSLYAFSFGIFILANNHVLFGNLRFIYSIILSLMSTWLLGATFVFLMAFILVAFERRLGKLFFLLVAGWILSLTFSTVFLNRFVVFQFSANVLIAASFSFCIFQLVTALREKRDGAWILMVGVQLFAAALLTSLLVNFKIIALPGDLGFFMELAILLAVPVAVSVFLARNFARVNVDLKKQLIQVEELSAQQIEQERLAVELRAENDRRAKELEEARQLQLSMLPKKLPQLPNLEIAAYMKPASEVGGDYYDFHVGADGTLTAVIGDATGHGLRAGSVVTATKSLFNAFASEDNIPQILQQTSRALKKMNLRGLFMAMTMFRLKDNNLTIAAAGMPSALVFRADSQTVEEVSIRALPLGSIANFTYRQMELPLFPGDCVLLMSDGFPEMFNAENEMLGFEKAGELLAETAASTPQEIINHLIRISEDWAGMRPPDDDVTFVVLKIV